jgi:hypothetical protein
MLRPPDWREYRLDAMRHEVSLAARVAAAALGIVALLSACDLGDEPRDPAPEELHARIIEALRTEQIRYLRYTFQEGEPDRVIEQHELWIDWEHERARLERTFPDEPLIVTVVADGLVHQHRDPPVPFDWVGLRPTFDAGAIPGTHLFQWLMWPEQTFREPLRRLSMTDGVERFSWAIEARDSDGGVCALITLELDAKSSLPTRSYAHACPELEHGEMRGYVTEYQSIDAVPRSTLPSDFFDPSAAAAPRDPSRPR